MKKTDLRNDESVMNIDVNLFDVVNTLTKDETVQETKHDEDKEMPKLTVLHGRQKELNCLKEMGAMTVGKRAIRTRWVDREKDRRLKSRLVLKDHNRCQERTQPEMFSPTPSTLSLKNDAGWLRAHTTETTIQNQTTSQLQLTYTAFLHADVDQDLFAEPPEPDEWYDAGLKEDEVWRLNRALYGYRKAPKLWHQHLVGILESLNYHPLLTDPSCFRNDETTVCCLDREAKF